jgi:hypothetical protein
MVRGPSQAPSRREIDRFSRRLLVAPVRRGFPMQRIAT